MKRILKKSKIKLGINKDVSGRINEKIKKEKENEEIDIETNEEKIKIINAPFEYFDYNWFRKIYEYYIEETKEENP